MTKSTITREQAEEAIDGLEGLISRGVQSVYLDIAIAGLRQLVPAMDQKPALHRYRRKAVEPYGPYPWHYEVFVDYPQPFEDIEDEYFYAAPPVVTGFAVDGESECLPLDYLQGHKDGLEWAAQLAEANHPETGDWLYDDPIELAKAIRKGPDMPPVKPAADSEPVAWTWHYREQWHVTNDKRRAEFVAKDGDVAVLPLYRHAQPAPVVPDAYVRDEHGRMMLNGVCEPKIGFGTGWNACRAAMLKAQPQNAPQNIPEIIPGWIQVSERMPPSRHEVLVGCWWGEKPRWCCKWATYIPGHPDAQSSGWLIPGGSWTPTHWMPLPAAPQEVKGE